MVRALKTLFLCVLLFWPLAARAHDEVVIGILANRPERVLSANYRPLAEYLSSRLKGMPVRVQVFDRNGLDRAVARREIDIVITNPIHYLLLRSQQKISGPIATFVGLQNGHASQSLGGVIITAAKRNDINRLSDLNGRQIATVGPDYFGGHQVQAMEFHKAGQPFPGEMKFEVFANQDDVVEAVLDGKADAGFVRSGLIETLASEGLLDTSRLRIINPYFYHNYPMAASTRLYPEWPVVALPFVEESIVRALASAVLALDPSHPASRAAHIGGFAPPSDYIEVEELARTLGIAPYDGIRVPLFTEIWRAHGPFLVVALVVFAAYVVATIFLLLAFGKIQRANEALFIERERLANIIWATNVGTWEWDVLSGVVSFNERWATMLGYQLEELGPQQIGLWRKLAHPDDLAHSDRLLTRHFRGETEFYECEVRVRHKEGHWVWVLDRGRIIKRRSDGEPLVMAGTHTDISTRKQAEETQRLAASVFTHATEGFIICDSEGNIVKVNDAFTRITGYSADEVVGKSPSMLRSGRHGPDFYADMWQNLAQNGSWSGEVWNRRKDGEVFAEQLNISAIPSGNGGIGHYVGIISDVTSEVEHQRELEHLAHYDALTGLCNRALLHDRLHLALLQAKRNETYLAIALFDLDGFKQVNDRLGHTAGDQLLIEIAKRCQKIMREVDTVARLGGDEFVVVMGDLTDADACRPLIDRLLKAIAEPITISGYEVKVSASAGITLFPQDGPVDADQLLRQADQAMYQAKQQGSNRYYVFDLEHDRRLRGDHESLERLREALRRKEFALHYQPKVNMRTGAVVGCEALLRWQHPERGLLTPGIFLTGIDDEKFAVELGEWVVDTALSQWQEWRSTGHQVPIGVNIFPQHMLQRDFAERMGLIMRRHAVEGQHCLEIEVLESHAIKDLAHTSAMIRACSDIGIDFAIDDFGSGYSSLSYLKHLPAHVLKIDQGFVRDVIDDPDDATILAGVVSLAAAFERTPVAEGVESEMHGRLLLRLGCEVGQGYGIARPMTAAAFVAWVDQWKPYPSWAGIRRLEANELPLFLAGTQHRAWVRSLDDFLQGVRLSPPPLGVRDCKFGKWLAAFPAAALRVKGVEDVLSLHRTIHAAAIDLIHLHNGGWKVSADAKLAEIKALRDTLMIMLDAILEAGTFARLQADDGGDEFVGAELNRKLAG